MRRASAFARRAGGVALAVSILLGLLAGCHSIASGKAAAERTMQDFYEKLQQHDFDAALDAYAPDFFVKTSRPRWRKTLIAVQDQLGPLREARLARWSVETQLGTDEGTYLQLVYTTRYERFSAEETCRLKRAADAGGFQIFTHEIRSAGLRAP
ncbi:MAG: hypothetical protein JO117_04620 [Verrucomicrobia bacterium]|nr:hypothetical protein [Verrucomicrobiota bacterium]MBV9658905.1 hypothetical protein [Verrucomicrobiota bacterium]